MVNYKFATREMKFAETLWVLFLCIFCCVITIEKYLPLHLKDDMHISKLFFFFNFIAFCF